MYFSCVAPAVHFLLTEETKMDRNFQENLRRNRAIRDFTQQQIADVLHCDRTTYSKYEHGTAYPTVDKLYILMDFYGVTASELLD